MPRRRDEAAAAAAPSGAVFPLFWLSSEVPFSSFFSLAPGAGGANWEVAAIMSRSAGSAAMVSSWRCHKSMKRAANAWSSALFTVDDPSPSCPVMPAT